MSATDPGRTVPTCDLFIAGRRVPPASERYFDTAEALTGTPIARVAAASPADARRAVDAAASALPSWPASRRPGAGRFSRGRRRCWTIGPSTWPR
ncbi:hypothetical protein [Actinomadura madurae]|uniref:hypothetical protein n=1 Tax=Actinomadura madurae TaxID=1993 RepID=UPI0020D23FE3|nr:hypothetical protein [Actinomadura madurae]MCP9955580.1 hypothetical protein [Actinomadura madurae]MCP9984825.1 hypothetical protein [Actinomadura madurae]MCQ0021013.1 hypothetical protein [Actinomadura madurae]